jgi:hypothetical protein
MPAPVLIRPASSLIILLRLIIFVVILILIIKWHHLCVQEVFNLGCESGSHHENK